MSEIKKLVRENFSAFKLQGQLLESYHLGMPLGMQVQCVSSEDMEKVVEEINKHQRQIYQKNSVVKLCFELNFFGNDGCAPLTHLQLSNIEELRLQNNLIGPEGCKYLSQISLRKMKNLYLGMNELGDEGCMHFTGAKWGKLQKICLNFCNIGAEGCQYIAQAQWPKLLEIIFYHNKIDDRGCKKLSRSDWKQLNFLQLGENQISEKGCNYLSKNFNKLIIINLYENKIGNRGCFHLSRGQWKDLEDLDMKNNAINGEGSRHIGKAQGTFNLDLRVNSIGREGNFFLEGKVRSIKSDPVKADGFRMIFS